MTIFKSENTFAMYLLLLKIFLMYFTLKSVVSLLMDHTLANSLSAIFFQIPSVQNRPAIAVGILSKM